MPEDAILIGTILEKDDIGQEVPAGETQVPVMGTKDSVTRQEWFTAGQAGFKASYRFKVYKCEYNNEDACILDGVKYSIYRTFEDGDYIELYLGTKVGVTYGDDSN